VCDRKVVAHAIAVAALVAGGRPAGGLHMASRPGVVPRRVAAMLHPRRRRLPLLYLVLPATLAAASVVWTAEAAVDLVELLMAAG
jgi:hypothetical protein